MGSFRIICAGGSVESYAAAAVLQPSGRAVEESNNRKNETGAITYKVLKRREDRVKAKRLQKAAEEERGGLMAIEAAE